jgi:hypothetical protein
MERNDIFGQIGSFGPYAHFAILAVAIGFLLYEASRDVRAAMAIDAACRKIVDWFAIFFVAVVMGVYLVLFLFWFAIAALLVGFRWTTNARKDSQVRLPDSSAAHTMNPSTLTPKGTE